MERRFERKVLLGVSGSIAAFKAAALVRELVKAGAEVQVVMTRSAHDFVTPLTLATLSGRPVLTDLISGEGTWNDHIHLARWADVMLIAPLSANTLSKLVHGQCDNLLLACYIKNVTDHRLPILRRILNRHAHQVAPFGPAAILVTHVGVAEQGS